MPASSYRWLIGKLVSVTVTGQNVDPTTGALTDSAAVLSFSGQTERAEIRYDPRIEEISDMSADNENDVVLKDRYELTLVEIQRKAGTSLATLIKNYEFFKIVLVAGAKTWTCYFRRGPGSFAFETGKSLASVTFRMIDTGEENPTYGDTAS